MARPARPVDPLAQRIGERIRRLRKERDIDFDAFVEETGLGRGHASMLERGTISPTVRTLAKVARVLDLTVADLVLGESPRERLFEVAQRLSSGELRKVVAEVEARVKRSSG